MICFRTLPDIACSVLGITCQWIAVALLLLGIRTALGETETINMTSGGTMLGIVHGATLYRRARPTRRIIAFIGVGAAAAICGMAFDAAYREAIGPPVVRATLLGIATGLFFGFVTAVMRVMWLRRAAN